MDSLPDLPLEEPAEAAASASPRPGSEPAPAPAAPDPVDPASTQTLLSPEALLAGDDEPTIPGLAEPPPEVPQLLEVDPDAPLTLDSGFEVDRMLSSAPPPQSQPPQPPTLRAAHVEEGLTLIPDAASGAKSAAAPHPAPKPPGVGPTPAAKGADAPPPAAPALVPLARRASLSIAAEKLAAAAAAATTPNQLPGSVKPAPPAASAPPVAPVKSRAAPAGAAASVTPIARKPAASHPASPATDAPPAPVTPSPPAQAPSLASWTSARAEAAASARTAASAAPRPAAPAPKPARPVVTEAARSVTEKLRPVSPPVPAPHPAAAAPAARAAVPAPSPATGSPARGMDRDFIARNQVVDRYFSGKLPIKAATDFERYCREHPELLDELGLPERVNAGLRLLEASGKPEPWQEAPKPIWQRPAATLGLAGFALLLALTLSIVVAGSASKSRKLLELQRQVADRTLDAATSTRIIRLLPNRSGATSTPAIVIGGGAAQLIDFHIDESRSPYKDFRVTIDRVDQGRVMVIDNLAKDSNGHLRIAVNSSAFGPGTYLLTIEGLTLRLEPQPDSWVTIGIAQR
ncbi:MAG TPA: hypothetical protein VEU78_08555 [Steroidobacteraceae bacterium]|nr:hypothetical protein [Steroidobacteraceae bacterium]